jgi:hypothetical protein
VSGPALLYSALGLLAALIVLAAIVEFRRRDEDDEEFVSFFGVTPFTLGVGGLAAFVILTLLAGVH